MDNDRDTNWEELVARLKERESFPESSKMLKAYFIKHDKRSYIKNIDCNMDNISRDTIKLLYILGNYKVSRKKRAHGGRLSSGILNKNVPRAAEKLMYLLLPHDRRRDLIGDLEEEYNTEILPKHGERFARFWYWKQAICSCLFLWLGKLAEFAAKIYRSASNG